MTRGKLPPTSDSTTTADGWDLPDIGPSHSEIHTIINDTITDTSTLGGMVSHNPVQNGSSETIYHDDWDDDSDITTPAASLGTATSHPNSESTTAGYFPGTTDPTDAYSGYKSALDSEIADSPVRQLIFPPGPVNHWEAPWSDPNSYWWTVGKWVVNPVGQAAATVLDFAAEGLQSLSQYAYDAGYNDLGLYLDLGADAAKVAGGIANPEGALIGLIDSGVTYGVAYGAKTGSVMDGILAGVGQVTGVNDLIEYSTSTDLLTGEHLTSDQADEKLFSGIAVATGAVAFGMSMAGIDVCLGGGCFVAGTEVVLGVVEEDASTEDPAKPHDGPQINLTGDGALLTLTHKYLTQNIELLRKDDLILSRHEFRPCDGNMLRRVEEVFVRKVFELQIITLRSSTGKLQTVRTTPAHPIYVWGFGWVASLDVSPGVQVMEPGGTLATVVESRRESHPDGILVYNFRVEGTHTYFVREAGSDAEPLWVHNVYVFRAINAEDSAALEAGEGLNPAGTGGTIIEQIQGYPTKYISASESEAGTERFESGYGVVKIDLDIAQEEGSGVVAHENVLHAAETKGTPQDVENVTTAEEILIKNGVHPRAITRIR